eukprot:5828610-Pleurochrysis_carterae.AAC.1
MHDACASTGRVRMMEGALREARARETPGDRGACSSTRTRRRRRTRAGRAPSSRGARHSVQTRQRRQARAKTA